ncbi:S8/S53 family peptidase [Actinokineospora soli]
MQPDHTMDEKFLSQWGAVRIAALDGHVELERSTDLSGNRTTPAFVYEKNHVLVRRDDLNDVVRGLVRGVDQEENGRGLDGVAVFKVEEPVADVIARVRSDRRVRPDAVTPNHLVSICPVQLCPADEPVPLPVSGSQEPYPPRTLGTGGLGVRVEVIDTGLVPGYEVGHEWLADIPEWHECISYGPTGTIKEYAGHGTFVTGVLRCAAPATEVRSMRVFAYAGATTEDQLGKALLDALKRDPHIISLSAGGSTSDHLPHLALEPFFTMLTEPGTRTLLVAAAGNDGSTDKFYPAAYAADAPDAVLSVGALRYDGEGRACFSNHGDWVRVYALGERHVNAFMSGGYSYVDPQQPKLKCRFYPENRLYGACTCVTTPPQGAVVAFRGMARWSGTSFSTPLVAGLIATHMSKTGEMDPRTAAKQVLATTRSITDPDGKAIEALGWGIGADL